MDKNTVLELYGNVPLKFNYYYKFSFTYTGTALDGTIIMATVGGNADDIYRSTVNYDSTITLNHDSHYTASLHRDGEELWSEYTY